MSALETQKKGGDKAPSGVKAITSFFDAGRGAAKPKVRWQTVPLQHARFFPNSIAPAVRVTADSLTAAVRVPSSIV